MFRYSGFSLTIHSQVELPELSNGGCQPDVTIRLGTVGPPRKLATIGDEVASPRNIGRFRITGGTEIMADLLPGVDTGILRTMLAGPLMAYLLRQRGYLPLHASAVAIDGQGVLFLGESGAGKSTTAAAFSVRGHDVLADDLAAVRVEKSGITLETAGCGLRLLEDSRKVIGTSAKSALQGGKHFCSLAGRASEGPYGVKRIYLLDYENCDGPAPVRSSALGRFSAAALLNARSFLRDWRAGDALRQINLDRSAALAAARTVCRLIRPRSLHLLPTLVDFVEKDVQRND
jgi:hypothetical protein